MNNNTTSLIKDRQEKIVDIRKHNTNHKRANVKWADMMNKRAVLMEQDMHVFINGIAKDDLFQKLQTVYKNCDAQKKQYYLDLHTTYIKTVRNSMVRNGFEENWVDTTFMKALNLRISKVS